ncbi:flagellar biosynthetic protein FliR [Glacieibacterium megasporae]|uniref:flagellar biosynthetic protein FliR n=1 Tax=Glacieibacterium megasporae TaxID=2835787 RepID=UPI001C1E315B|nr:flagellar biosynthetic protein FliR [Polymorphobacter megasporae]UAJ09605.1 flagellar biosynthetic protein FliR [Polymorphobacter megasporae]
MIAVWLATPEVEAGRLLFASLRTASALSLLPGIGAMLMPLRVRIGLGGAIGVFVLGVTPIAVPADLFSASGLIAVASEILIGAMAGVMLQAVFAGASIAGEVIAQSMGLGFATILDPGGMTSPVIATLLGLVAWLVFFALDGHLRLFEVLVTSYRALPPGCDPLALAGRVAGVGALAFASGLMLALPVAAVLFLINLLLAVAARSAPQLNLFAIGFPVLMLSGVVLLAVAMPAIVDTMAAGMATMQDRLEGILLG